MIIVKPEHNNQIKEMRYAHSLLKALCVSKRRVTAESRALHI